MAKQYIPCTTVEECKAACAAGLLYWHARGPDLWFKYPYSDAHYGKELWDEQLTNWGPSVLVDTDE